MVDLLNMTASEILARGLKSQLFDMYHKAKGVRPCSGCISVKEILDELKYTKNMNEYIIKKGCLIRFKGQAYTNSNITDDIASEYLKTFPMRIDMFSKVAESTELNDTDSPSDEFRTELSKMTKKQLLNIYGDEDYIRVRMGKDDMIEAIIYNQDNESTLML